LLPSPFLSAFPNSGKRAASQVEDGDAALLERVILRRPRFWRCCSPCGMCGRGEKGAATALAVAARVSAEMDGVCRSRASR
jgi:hypothetical protein